MSKALAQPSKRLRGPIARGLGSGDESRVDREGGDRNVGLIRGASIIVEGEALGHDAWVDATFLSQVAEKINDAGETGVKARFTHPSLSGDGLGSMFARVKNASVVGDRVVADLHMTEAGHKTPDGDLAAYVMDLAEEDGDAFGVSISFMRNMGEEKKFAANNSDENGRFRSPDKRNKDNYRHFRLSRLIAADVVDEPAANPDGLFTKASQRIAHEGADLVSFALGQTSEPPELALLDIDPTRIRDFAKRYLAEHDLAIVKTSERKNKMDTETKTDESDDLGTSDTPETPNAPEAETQTSENVDEAVKKALAADRKRTAEIRNLGAKFGFGKDAEEFAASEKSVEEFRSHILSKSPEDWKASLQIRNPAHQESEDASDDSAAKEAIAKVKARRKSRTGN